MGCGPLTPLHHPLEDDKLPDAVSRNSSVYTHNYSPQLTSILSLINDNQRLEI